VFSEWSAQNRFKIAFKIQIAIFKYEKVNMLKCDTMSYSKVQSRAIAQIEMVVEHFGANRWFTQNELTGVGYHTMMALVNKKYLRDRYTNGVSYYQVV